MEKNKFKTLGEIARVFSYFNVNEKIIKITEIIDNPKKLEEKILKEKAEIILEDCIKNYLQKKCNLSQELII